MKCGLRSYLFFALLLAFGVASAQSPAPHPDSTADSVRSVTYRPDLYEGTVYADRPYDSSHTQNPTVALFKSVVVPGWGQLGNKKYLTAALVIAVEGYFIGNLIDHGRKTTNAKYAFDHTADTSRLQGLYDNYLNAKDNRNYYSWMTGLTIFISMFDAYVDAHLARFPKYDKKISFRLETAPQRPLGAVITCRF